MDSTEFFTELAKVMVIPAASYGFLVLIHVVLGIT